MFISIKTKNQSSEDWIDSSTQNEFRFISGGIIANIIKRVAQPYTYAEVSDNTLSIGYTTNNNREYLDAKIKSDGTLRINRDDQATLPIFYSLTNGEFWLSNSYKELRQRSGRLDQAQLARYLYLLGDSWDTLDENIKILAPSTELYFDGHRVMLKRTSHRNPSKESIKAQEFPKILQTEASKIYTEYDINDVVVEASGGLDSSAAAILAYRDGRQVSLISAEFEGDQAERQLNKLGKLAEFLSADLNILPYTKDQCRPLQRIIDGQYEPFYEFSEIYTESLTQLADQLQKNGVNHIITGIGGNELFEDSPLSHELVYGEYANKLLKRQYENLSESMEQRRRQAIEGIALQPTVEPYPLIRSVYAAHVATNNIFIDKGIWPITPFASVPLFNFTSSLPASLKANKNILRSWYKAIGAPEELYVSSSNEYFSSMLESTIDETFKIISKQLNAPEVWSHFGVLDKSVNTSKLPAIYKYGILVCAINLPGLKS